MRRSSAFTDGSLTKCCVGEYSSLSRLGVRTSTRTAPTWTMAERWAIPADVSIGVARSTGEASVRAVLAGWDPEATAPDQTTKSPETSNGATIRARRLAGLWHAIVAHHRIAIPWTPSPRQAGKTCPNAGSMTLPPVGALAQ